MQKKMNVMEKSASGREKHQLKYLVTWARTNMLFEGGIFPIPFKIGYNNVINWIALECAE